MDTLDSNSHTSEIPSAYSPHGQSSLGVTETPNNTNTNKSDGVFITGISERVSQEFMVPLDTLWYIIHAVAIVSLTVSIISSVLVILWQQRASSATQFFKRKLGERLVVYLAVTDLFYSISHFLDHLVNLVGHGVPSHTPCVVFASVTMECIFAQSIIVLFTAVSLCLLVSCNRKINYGPFDVILLIISYGPPLVVVVFSLSKGYIGNNGYWCFLNAANPSAVQVLDIMADSQLAVALIIIALYVCVWITIAHSLRRLKKFPSNSTPPQTSISSRESMSERTTSHLRSRRKTYIKTSKVLTLFVVAYLAQWWPSMVFFGLRRVVGDHPYYNVPFVIFFNVGGLFNMFAYTFVRRYTFRR